MRAADVPRTQRAIIVTAATFGLTYGLSSPLIALELAEAGYSPLLIGLNAAMYAIGVLLIAPLLPRLAWRLGLPRLAGGALGAAAVLLAAFPFSALLWPWFVLRAALGMASETLFVVSETWLNDTAQEQTRARTMAVYVATLSSGIALGPMVLVLAGRDGPAPFLIGAGLALAALALLLAARPRAPRPEAPTHAGLLPYLRLAPLAVAAAAMNAAIESAGLGLLPLYAMTLGWSEQSATLLLTVLLGGAIVLQLPIGWLGDRMPRRRLVLLLSALATVGALVWPLALGHAWLAYPLLFAWGGAFVGIYTLMLAILGERFSGSDLAGAFGLVSIAWGLGALAGPVLGGWAMHVSAHGLPWFAALVCGLFTLAAIVGASRQR